jgi:hypothetical protein
MGSASDFPENKLATVLMVVVGLGIAALTIADVPPASWITEFQARSLGYYSRELTMVVLVIVILGPAAAIWAIVKAVREGSAAYARGEDEDDEDLYPPPAEAPAQRL